MLRLCCVVDYLANPRPRSSHSRWADSGEIDLRETFAELIILTASATLMGKDVRANLIEEMARIYHALDNGLTPFSVVFPPIPPSPQLQNRCAPT